MHRLILLVVLVILNIAPLTQAYAAFEDPTGGKPFIPWLWEDQFKPTIKEAGKPANLSILGLGTAATVVAHQYDGDVESHAAKRRLLSPDARGLGSLVGSGMPGITVAVAQLFFDQKNGLAHARAISLTSFSHITTAVIANRSRPNGKDRLSFPSGHGSSSYATAFSLGYAYGPLVGVPAVAVATFVSLARIEDRAHWFSDTVAGAALGFFWARASARSDDTTGEVTFMPILVPGGALASIHASF